MGRPGVGKTCLAKTIGESTLLISAEAGHLVLSDSEIDMIDISTNDSGELIQEQLRIDRLFEVYNFIQQPDVRKKYKWIFIDSLTEISDFVLKKVQSEPRFKDPKMAMLAWGEYTKIMTNLIKLFRDLPYFNVAFTAISDESEDKDGNPRKIKPLLQGQKMPERVGGFFDELFYMGVKEEKDVVKRYILTAGSSQIEAKDRSGKLNKFEAPNLSLIARKIRGEQSNVSE
jgi:hypothetical protein